MYFTECTTIDQAKTLFRGLCKDLHPDKGGNASEFIAMYNEFKRFKPRTDKFNQSDNFNADKFYNLIQKFDGLHGIKINFVGSFIWLEDIVSGAMYQQRLTIKALDIDGYNTARWANKKKSWYFSPSTYKKKSKKTYSMDKLKSTFGCNEFSTRERKLIS